MKSLSKICYKSIMAICATHYTYGTAVKIHVWLNWICMLCHFY